MKHSYAAVRVTSLQRDTKSGSGWWIAFASSDSITFCLAVAYIKAMPVDHRSFKPDAPGGPVWWIHEIEMVRMFRDWPGLAKWRVEYNTPPRQKQQEEPKAKQRQEAPSARAHVPVVPQAVQDAYAVLFVTLQAPKAIITAAHRTLAKSHHPDIAGTAGTAQMTIINLSAETALDWNARHFGKGA